MDNCSDSESAVLLAKSDSKYKGARGWNIKQAVEATGSTYVAKGPKVDSGVITLKSTGIKVGKNSTFSLVLVPEENTKNSSVGTALNWSVSSASSCLDVDLC